MNAVEWVRYANIRKKYNVQYWEIGNENWHNKTGTPEELSEIVVEFSQAMKAVDPNIKVGASGKSDTWWKDFLPRTAQHIDFLVVSEYPCWEWRGYDYYRDHKTINLIPTATIAADAIIQTSLVISPYLWICLSTQAWAFSIISATVSMSVRVISISW